MWPLLVGILGAVAGFGAAVGTTYVIEILASLPLWAIITALTGYIPSLSLVRIVAIALAGLSGGAVGGVVFASVRWLLLKPVNHRHNHHLSRAIIIGALLWLVLFTILNALK